MAVLTLSLLGAFQATREGKSVVGFESNKVRALLIYLAVEADQPHSREELAGMLWPERSEQAARSNLRQALANLRQTLAGDGSESPYLLVTPEGVQLNREADVVLDVQVFSDLLESASRHQHRREESCQRCAGWLKEAASIYRGDFLEHFYVQDSASFEEWVLVTRERLRSKALSALTRLGAYYEQRGTYEDCLHYARRLVQLDPWREEAHRMIMRASVLSGQRSAALAQYRTCQQMLADELGAEPSEETETLYKQIKSGKSLSVREEQHIPLPVQLTPFLGREKETEELTALIDGPSCRMVSICGPGGIGKTRLAIQAAERQKGAFPDGVFLIPLAGLSPEDSLAEDSLAEGSLALAITTGIGLKLKGQADPREQLLRYLAEKEMLLVLDNFEHLLAGGSNANARLLADMLRAAPHLSLLVTSRERLNLRAETVYDLDGFPIPATEDPVEMEANSAVQLFLQQARQVNRGFRLEGDEASAVRQICRLVEGMPLAIEMAAGGTRTQSCRQIVSELERGLQALATQMEDMPERHRSMRATFDHSWYLLSPVEQRCLEAFSVYRGGIPEEAAAHIASMNGGALTGLVDKSFLRRDPTGRYSMHELFRQYAGERLRESGEEQQARNAHLTWYRSFAGQAELDLYSEQQTEALRRMESDHDNLRAALGWAVESRQHQAAAGLASPLSRFWGLRGYLSEGRAWMDKVLALFDGDPSEAVSREYARTLRGAGALAWRQGDFGLAITHLEASLENFEALGDEAETRLTLRVIATVESSRGNDEQAIAVLRECLESDERAGDWDGIAYDYGSLADSMYFMGDLPQAKHYYEESLARHRARKDDYSIGVCLNNLGEVSRVLGEHRESAAFIEEAIALFRKMDSKQSLAMAMMNLGELELLLGEEEQAHLRLCEALRLQQELNAVGDIACNLPNFAALAVRRQELERAARLYAAATALQEVTEVSIAPAQAAEHQANIENLRQRLQQSDFQKAWEAGNAMTVEEAIAYALGQQAGGLIK